MVEERRVSVKARTGARGQATGPFPTPPSCAASHAAQPRGPHLGQQGDHEDVAGGGEEGHGVKAAAGVGARQGRWGGCRGSAGRCKAGEGPPLRGADPSGQASARAGSAHVSSPGGSRSVLRFAGSASHCSVSCSQVGVGGGGQGGAGLRDGWQARRGARACDGQQPAPHPCNRLPACQRCQPATRPAQPSLSSPWAADQCWRPDQTAACCPASAAAARPPPSAASPRWAAAAPPPRAGSQT